MQQEPIRQIDEIYTLARALEAAAQAAANMAIEAGADQTQVAAALAQAKKSTGAQDLSDLASPLSDLGKAQRQLLGRRIICRSLIALAIDHGVDRDEITERLDRVSEWSVQIYRAETLTDLGF